jgi:hypothetical protein
LEDEFHESASHGYNFVISPCDWTNWTTPYVPIAPVE